MSLEREDNAEDLSAAESETTPALGSEESDSAAASSEASPQASPEEAPEPETVQAEAPPEVSANEGGSAPAESGALSLEPSVAASPAAPESTPEEEDPTQGTGAQIALVVALTLGLIGFVTGLSQPKLARAHEASAPSAEGPAGVPTAPRYAELHETNLGPNAEWTNGLEKIPALSHDLFAERKVPGLRAKQEGLKARATRRAYAGAPPTVPHQVSARSAASCLSCHEKGRRIGDRVASPMPHALLVNCLQCHAPPPPDALSKSVPGTAQSLFEGQAEPLAGSRAGVGSPPVIPHTTRMRENCVACHGPQGSTPALQTTHPWRVNCRQCHAASTAGYAK